MDESIKGGIQVKLNNILGDSIGSLELIDHMGGDTQVVNSARVSYGKQVDELTDKDKRLLQRLIKDKHVSVLRSTVFTFRVKMPMAIRNQFYKHIIGCAYASDQLGFNEVSRRYTEENIELYFPTEFREQDPDNKQSSRPMSLGQLPGVAVGDRAWIKSVYECSVNAGVKDYEILLELGVAREQARMVLPQCLYTEFIWTASLQAVLHFLDLRDKADSQWEIQQYAQGIRQLIAPVVPVTLEYWEGSQYDP
jgi:thymidylate synthase (FAD)